MNKKLVVLAIAALPFTAQAAGTTTAVSGFADITYDVSNDLTAKCTSGSTACTENKFSANGEVDFSATQEKVTVRVDADVNLATNGGASTGGDSGRIEQAFLAAELHKQFTLIAGVFNNPVGMEKEDAPDLYTVNHGQIYNILDDQTVLYGNNIAGVAGAFNLGPATVTVGYLNDLYQTDDENSYALVVNATPVKGLDVELGYVTQAAQTDSAHGTSSAEDWWNLNAMYTMGGLTVGAEYLSADKVVENAYQLLGSYNFGNGFGVGARYDNVSYEATGTKDTSTVSLIVTHYHSKNLAINLEWRDQSDDNDTTTGPGGGKIGDGDAITAEFVASFM